MLCKLYSKKGNITVVLIGLISVMLILTITMARRMTSHTQLLTLGDYTQISRYFLESYVGDIMQWIRHEANEPGSDFSKEICKNDVDTIDTNKALANYGHSAALKELIDNLEMEKVTHKFDIIQGEALGYPEGLNPGEIGNKEKRGFIQLTCECRFKKRDYKLVVQYPFIVVARVTPVLKDFMLFVDHMADEQKEIDKDYINILKIDRDKVSDSQDLKEGSFQRIKPFYLLAPLDPRFDNFKTSGMVYLGPSQDAVYINLAGGHMDSPANETFIVSPDDVAPSTNVEDLQEIDLMDKDDTGIDIKMRGMYVDLASDQDKARMGVMGFSTDFAHVFDGSKYNIEEFLGNTDDSSYWSAIRKNGTSGANKLMSYASALKIYGLNAKDEHNNAVITNRSIFGNVFARFAILTFWWIGSGQGKPLVYNPNITDTNQVPEGLLFNGDTRPFKTLNGESYQYFQSRIMSGLNWKEGDNKRLVDAEDSKYYMAMNINDELKVHAPFYEGDFKPNDGIELNGLKFDKFGNTWFKGNGVGNEPSPIEKRIGRTFTNQEDFKEAVGYNNGKFKINGVVYVDGDLELEEMNLSKDDCSGGIVVVGGNLKLGSIKRGENISDNNFKLGGSRSAINYFTNWNNPDPNNDHFIGQDKILTFVCINNGKTITITGNILLGVQLINVTDPNSYTPQIKWDSSVTDGIIFYGSIVCNRLQLKERIIEFGRTKTDPNDLDAPFFMYPPVMASETTSLAVQIMENMRGYQLTSGKVAE